MTTTSPNLSEVASLRQEVRALMTEVRLRDMTTAELKALVDILGEASLRIAVEEAEKLETLTDPSGARGSSTTGTGCNRSPAVACVGVSWVSRFGVIARHRQ